MKRVGPAPLLLGLVLLSAGCLGGGKVAVQPPAAEPAPPQAPAYRPHVLVAVPDSGVNPYHSLYYRPDLTQPPCTYLRDFPCDLAPLNLTVGGDDWDAAFEADRAVWDSIEVGKWYWIPRTVFVAVYCESPYSQRTPSPAGSGQDYCILDDTSPHGTGTTSSVVMENPEALLAFKEGGPSIQPFLDAKLPVDVFSVSWGSVVPLPIPTLGGAFDVHQPSPIYVKAAGNDPRPTLTDFQSGDPRVISVGGAYAQDKTEEPLAAKMVDVVSYYCRPTAKNNTVSDLRPSYCGTSFAAPTVAGALSKVILALRTQSGYDGGNVDGFVDPVRGVTLAQLRDAMNRTASYEPRAKYDNTARLVPGLPRNDVAPWLQWGWGFYDGDVANATIAHLLGAASAPEKPAEARQYMETLDRAKWALYGA